MLLFAWPTSPARTSCCRSPWRVAVLLLITLLARCAYGMTAEEVSRLRQDTEDLFYHGFDNYMAHAYPEDELKPISCQPQTRNRQDPSDIGLNDVLGNYSLTLIDSLSTLAILASDEIKPRGKRKRNPLGDFQDGVKNLVGLYGDGTADKPCGTRACGFDLDSKVQVFETNIRGVGGLLSAHLFAVGELPIRGYNPQYQEKKGKRYIQWKNGFRYQNQLLHLAQDLASRLLPAFDTPTGIPYPRVNLRYGIPFYRPSEPGVCRVDGSSSDIREITENCAAGAGSLVLEFSTLSRLTGDMTYENAAKRAFWAIWNRRSSIDLVGNGIDAETGHWTQPSLSGIGAGIDSFFEYSMKSHILLSNLPYNTSEKEIHHPDNFLQVWHQAHAAVTHHIYRDSSLEKHPYYGVVDTTSGAPRYTWVDNLSAYYPGLLVLAGEVDEAIESHLLFTALWTRYSALPERWHALTASIDANFRHWAGRPEFIESTFYLYQATHDPYYLHVGEMTLRDVRRRCWTQCGWSDLANVETGEKRDRMESFFLGETAKYLYLLLTDDHPLNKLDAPYVFTTEGHPLVIPRGGDGVGEGASAELGRSRATSTSRYIHPDHATCPAPLDPLPLTVSNIAARENLFHASAMSQLYLTPVDPAHSSPSESSSIHELGTNNANSRSSTNYTFFPWTLPPSLIPPSGISLPIRNSILSTLTFPNLQGLDPLSSAARFLEAGGILPQLGSVQKLPDGVLITSLSNIKLNMVQEMKQYTLASGETLGFPELRISGIANWALGKDEKVLVTGEAVRGLGAGGEDEHFRRVKDLEKVDLVLDVPVVVGDGGEEEEEGGSESEEGAVDSLWNDLSSKLSGLLSSIHGKGAVSDSDGESIVAAATHPSTEAGSSDTTAAKVVVTPAPPIPSPSTKPTSSASSPPLQRRFITGLLPVGPGAAPLSSGLDSFESPIWNINTIGHLPLSNIFYLHSDLCNSHHILPARIPKNYSVLVIQRGGCSFSEKLANIPAYVPGSSTTHPDSNGLQLVVILSTPPSSSTSHSASGGFPEEEDDEIANHANTRPLLDSIQRTPNGFERRYPIPVVLVDGGMGASILRAPGITGEFKEEEVFSNEEAFRRLAKMEGRFDEDGVLVEWEGVRVGRGRGERDGKKKAMAVKRRYWFESLGVVITNLAMV